MQERWQITDWGPTWGRGGEVFLDLRCCFPNVIKLSFSRHQEEYFHLSPLFEAKLCVQNEFIIWGPVSPRGRGTGSHGWRLWPFLHLLKGMSQPKSHVVTLQRSVYIAGGERLAYDYDSTHIKVFLQISRATLNTGSGDRSLYLCLRTPHIPQTIH